MPGHFQLRLAGRRNRLFFRQIALLIAVFGTGLVAGSAWAQSVSCLGTCAIVTNGKFTNVYVYPHSDQMTWEQNLAFSSFSPDQQEKFSRASIDAFTRELMRPVWPSYFDPLFQYTTGLGPIGKDNIHPPEFFGSGVALKSCVDKALQSVRYQAGAVLDWFAIRDLANCHTAGMDPSPQVNLIFSPDIAIADIADSFAIPPNEPPPNMCEKKDGASAYHSTGRDAPNFTVLPTSKVCAPTGFADFTNNLSHEVVELLSDPGGVGYGTFGINEVADLCDKEATVVSGFSLTRYWSNFDGNCQPRLDPASGEIAETWVLGQGSPLRRFTGHVHTLTLGVPASRVISDAPVTNAILVIQTGADDLGGGSNPRNNANATLNFVGGQTVTTNINQGRTWNDGETHAVTLTLPDSPLRVRDIRGVTITTNFGGLFPDNWNVDKVALVVSFPPCDACTIASSIASGCTIDRPNLASIDAAHGTVTFRNRMSGHMKLTCPMTSMKNTPTGPTFTGLVPPPVHDWMIASGIPLIRFTGQTHDLSLAMQQWSTPVAAQDVGQQVAALNLTISTGNDNLNGGSNPGDNCDVTVQLTSGQSIVLRNVNAGGTWDGWTHHTISIPLPPGVRGGDIQAVLLHTGFRGGPGGDNWNVEQVILQATLAVPALPLQLGMTFYNDRGFEGGVDHCSLTADLLRTNLNDVEAGADIATITTAGMALFGRQTLGKDVGALDFATSYYWVDIDLFRDSGVAACNPTIVGTNLRPSVLAH